ncbi:hypothetical protein D3C81_1510490 [compost metagenome]
MAGIVAFSGAPGNDSRNHSRMVSARMMPPTRLRKIIARSYKPTAKSRGCGTRYDGNSSISGCSLLSRRNFFIVHDITSALRMPARYRPNSTRPCWLNMPHTVLAGMKAPINSAYTGSRAEQVINGATRIVARRSRGSWMERVDMMPGTAQAKLESSGMNERPDKPAAAIMRSSRNAARGR